MSVAVPTANSDLRDPDPSMEEQDQRPDASLRQHASCGERRSFALAAVFTFVVAIVPAVLWPGAISWMCDEPMLVSQAWHYNQQHRVAARGLGGSFDIPYGPFGTQFYQLLLLFTNDVRVLVLVRALFCSALLAFSLLWLARSLRLTPWFAAAVVLAPYLVWTERVLWDASFAIPICTLAVAAYASFLRKGSAIMLGIAVAAAALDPLIHMQGLPLFFALAGHAFWRHLAQVRRCRESQRLTSFSAALRHHHRTLGRHWIAVIIAVAFVCVLNVSYIQPFIECTRPKLVSMFTAGYNHRATENKLLESISGPFWAGRLLTAENWVVPKTGLPGPAWVSEWAEFAATAIFPIIWLGMAIAVLRLLWLAMRSLWQAKAEAPARSRSTVPVDAIALRDSLTGIALICLVLQMALAGSLRVPPFPQYSFGTFPFHILFGWLGIEFLRKIWLGFRIADANSPNRVLRHINRLLLWRAGDLVMLGWALSVGYFTVAGGWQIEHKGWPRGLMSPSLTNQIEVAQALNRYSDTTVRTEVGMYDQYPVAIRALRLLQPPTPGVPQIASPHGLWIRYVPGPDSRSSRIELVDLPPPSIVDVRIFSSSVIHLSVYPVTAKEVDVTPLQVLY